jgi:hypothetical protein
MVDYDLLHVDEDNARYTGEGVARLARAFADCHVIVILNQYPEAQFDLSLRGHIVSHADLNIDAHLMKNAGLWSPPPWEGFRPWAWEVLGAAVARQKKRLKDLEKGLSQPIINLIGMTAEDASSLSDGAFGFIAPKAKNFQELAAQTFDLFLGTTTDGKDAHSLGGKGSAAACRFAAARVSKWLERELLGPQDVLVDVPHLLQRLPFLLSGDRADPATWDQAIRDEGPLRDAVPKDVWFSADGWLSRPAVWWHRLERDPVVRKRRTEFDFSTVPDFVFLEDVSSFCPRSEATEFRAGFHNAYDRRFAKVVDGVRYAPQRRFAFGA